MSRERGLESLRNPVSRKYTDGELSSRLKGLADLDVRDIEEIEPVLLRIKSLALDRNPFLLRL